MRATTREQNNGKGLARGLMQFQPNGLRTTLKGICDIADKDQKIENLAAAAGVKKEDMQKAIDDYKTEYDNNKDEKGNRKNEWPTKGKGTKIKEWLEKGPDTFAIKLMFYELSINVGLDKLPEKCNDFASQYDFWQKTLE